MQSFSFFVLLALATACSVHCQMLGDPGTEPWSMVTIPACATKNVNIQEAQERAATCTKNLEDPRNPMAICQKQKQRNNCLKDYYDTLKKCFGDDGDVKKAYDAQKASIKHVCKDDMKETKSLTPDDMKCVEKMQDPSVQTCSQNLVSKTMPDMKKLFSANNCKLINGLVKCQTDAMKSCKTSKFSDYFKGQFEAIMEKTPCDMMNSAPTAVIVTPLLLVCLISHAFFKSLF